MNKISSIDYCRNFVRKENYNLYLLHFFVSRKYREKIIPLMALHTELLTIPQKASDPTMRLIRLQWWRDEIKKMQGGKTHADSPILDLLSQNLDYEDYLNRFDSSLRGEDIDIEEALYTLFGNILKNEKEKNKLSKKLFIHDNLPEHTKFRALRLWLGV